MPVHLTVPVLRSRPSNTSAASETGLALTLLPVLYNRSGFGGAPTDYQFVEREDADGLPRIDLRVSPSVALRNTDDARELVLTTLNRGKAHGYADRWREAGTLNVIRDEPLVTGAGKIIALHSLRKKPERQS